MELTGTRLLMKLLKLIQEQKKFDSLRIEKIDHTQSIIVNKIPKENVL